MNAVPEQLWRAVEALHSVVYFAPDATERYGQHGLRGFWRGYFASRAGALGTPGPELVTATFHGFAPAFVARAVPEVWDLADRGAVLAERSRVAVDALDAAWGDARPTAAVADAAAGVLDGLDLGGRPLAAAHLDLPVPQGDTARLWHAVTVLRELHGDSHVAVLVTEGVDGCSANVLATALGLAPPAQREVRGWDEAAWAAAAERLRSRGWLGADGAATTSGRAAREAIEERTHAVAEAALGAGGRRAVGDLTEQLVALARPLETTGPLTYPNPTAVPRP